MKIIISMLENMDCTQYMHPGEFNLMGKLLGELYTNYNNKKTPKEYNSYIFQAICMSLFNNAKVTL